MKLSKRLEGEFSAAIRQQGQTYHWQHLIRIREGDSRRVEAEVDRAPNVTVCALIGMRPFLPFFAIVPISKKKERASICGRRF